MTPECIQVCSLDVDPLSDLVDVSLGINGIGGVFSLLLSYVIIRVQAKRVWGYDGHQVALVIPYSIIDH